MVSLMPGTTRDEPAERKVQMRPSAVKADARCEMLDARNLSETQELFASGGGESF